MIRIALTVVCALFLVSSVKGQETQLPFDSKGALFVITTEHQQRWDILTSYDGLVEARLYLINGTDHVLEVTLHRGADRVRDRVPITPDAYRDLVSRVDAALDREGVDLERDIDQSGRTSLIVGSTLWSLFYYGAAASIALTNDASLGWSYLFAGSAGLFVPLLLTIDAPVSDAASTLALGGMFQGVLHGWALSAMAMGDAIGDQQRIPFGLSVVTGIAETVAGYAVATNTGMEPGRASVIATTCFYGLATGVFTSLVIADVSTMSSDLGVRLGGGLSLAGAITGILVGDALADAQHFSPGDGSIYATSGFLGMTLPMAILFGFGNGDVSPGLLGATSIVTTIGGLYLGTALIRGRNYRSSDGTICILSTLGGGLLGLGAGLLMPGSGPEALFPWIGAAAGFGLSFAFARPTAERSMGFFEVGVDPSAVFTTRYDQYGFVRHIPAAQLHYRF